MCALWFFFALLIFVAHDFQCPLKDATCGITAHRMAYFMKARSLKLNFEALKLILSRITLVFGKRLKWTKAAAGMEHFQLLLQASLLIINSLLSVESTMWIKDLGRVSNPGKPCGIQILCSFASDFLVAAVSERAIYSALLVVQVI